MKALLEWGDGGSGGDWPCRVIKDFLVVMEGGGGLALSRNQRLFGGGGRGGGGVLALSRNQRVFGGDGGGGGWPCRVIKDFLVVVDGGGGGRSGLVA